MKLISKKIIFIFLFFGIFFYILERIFGGIVLDILWVIFCFLFIGAVFEYIRNEKAQERINNNKNKQED